MSVSLHKLIHDKKWVGEELLAGIKSRSYAERILPSRPFEYNGRVVSVDGSDKVVSILKTCRKRVNLRDVANGVDVIKAAARDMAFWWDMRFLWLINTKVDQTGMEISRATKTSRAGREEIVGAMQLLESHGYRPEVVLANRETLMRCSDGYVVGDVARDAIVCGLRFVIPRNTSLVDDAYVFGGVGAGLYMSQPIIEVFPDTGGYFWEASTFVNLTADNINVVRCR